MQATKSVGVKLKDKNVSDATRLRPEASFKIKDAYSKVLQEQTVQKEVKEEVKHERVEADDPIDDIKVSAALERYILENNPEQTVVIALRTHKPVVEDNRITILVDNQLQCEKLEAVRMYFHHFLMKALNNGAISLNIALFNGGQSVEEKKYYTAGEKYEHLLELNPVVADLKRIFGLELD